MFEDSTEAAYIFTYEGSHWLRYLIGCAASPLARPSLAHACEVPFPYRGLRWRPRQMVVPLTYTCTDSRNLPFTSFYVGVKVNAVGVKVKVAAQWLWGVKVNMGG